MLIWMSAHSNTLSYNDIKNAIEHGDIAAKAQAMETLIRQHVNGESQNHMIMSVIKFLTPLDDHYIKKLVLYFWEVIDKTDEEGNLLSEIILICSFLRNDLQHPNEYVRGLTLRFLCKVQEKELVEPLVSAAVQNLTHRVTYVRRSAVLAVHGIYKKFPDLVPDAVELIESAIRTEVDVSSRRNAFDMLADVAPERAAVFLAEYCEENDLVEAGSAFLMSVVNFCRQRIRASGMEKGRYVPVLFAVLQSPDSAVRYQCASTLLSLSSSPTAITQATLTYIDILRTHTDNTVRLIVLEQLINMKEKYSDVMQESMQDILSVLHQGGPTEMRQSVWRLATDLVSSSTVDSFVAMIRKEMLHINQELSAAGGNAGGGASVGSVAASVLLEHYRLDLIRALSVAVDRFPAVADQVVVTLPDYYFHTNTSSSGGGDSPAYGSAATGRAFTTNSGQSHHNSSNPGMPGGVAEGSNLELLVLMKRVLFQRPAVREAALKRLRTAFHVFGHSDLLRAALWMFGAFSKPSTVADATAANAAISGDNGNDGLLEDTALYNDTGAVAVLHTIFEALGTLPITPFKQNTATTPSPSSLFGGEDKGATNVGLKAVTTVREDGTYATTFVPVTTGSGERGEGEEEGGAGSNVAGGASLRVLIQLGDGFLVSSLASSLVRLVQIQEGDATETGRLLASAARSKVMSVLVELLRYAASVNQTPYELDDDAQEQLRLSLSMLGAPSTGSSREIWEESLKTSVELIVSPSSSSAAVGADGAKKKNDAEEKGITEGTNSSHLIDQRLALSFDTPLIFSQLSPGGSEEVFDTKGGIEKLGDADNFSNTNSGAGAEALSPSDFLQRLEHVVPLSGTSDPIYCEASVTVNEFDVSVDWRLINCTSHLLSNIMVDLASLGGVKLCERPQMYSLAPGATHTMRTSLKVDSTETGVIFSSLVFEYPDGTHACVVLNNIDVDIMSYIKPVAALSDAAFRRRWRSLDWENKIVISTPLRDLDAYVRLVRRELNMGSTQDESLEHQQDAIDRIIGGSAHGHTTTTTTAETKRGRRRRTQTPPDDNDNEEEEEGEVDEEEVDEEEEEGVGAQGCLSYNLAAHTAFGEDVLANISAECDAKGVISGIVRIRSGTHTLAYGVGKKLNALQEHRTVA